MQNNLLSEKCINLWRMRATVILILLSFIDGGLFVFFPDWSIFLGIIAVIAYFLMIIFYFPTLYKKCGYFFEKDIISISSGVFVYHQTKIPVSQIQYCVISQGYLQKIYGLCSVRLMLAGSFESVSQITLINAYRLKNRIEHSGEQNGKKKI